MIKKLIKVLSIIFLLVILVISYLSLVGVKTEKLNERIKDKIYKTNKKINLDLRGVKFLLDPYNFKLNIITKNPTVLLEGNKFEIKEIKTIMSLKALIFNEFSLDNLQISTKFIKLEDLISLARSFENSTELFLLDRVIKNGLITADIKLEFDKKGNIKKNYQIIGFIKNFELDFLKKIKAINVSFKFDFQKDKYSLKAINGEINGIELSSPLIEINQKKINF